MYKRMLLILGLLLLMAVAAQPALAAGYAVPFPEVKAGHGFVGMETIWRGGTYSYTGVYGGEYGLTNRLALTGQVDRTFDFVSVGARYQMSPALSLAGRYSIDRSGYNPSVITVSLLGGKDVARNLYAYASADAVFAPGYGTPSLYWETGAKYQLSRQFDIFGRVSQAWIQDDAFYTPVKVFGAEYQFLPGISGGLAWSDNNTYLYATKTF